MQVVCVNVGKKFEPEYVYRLQRALQLHLGIPHDFAVITDRPELYSCRTLPAMDNLQGWWQKVTLFADRDYSSNRIMYLDLDVVIRGSIKEIALFDAPFITMLDRWQHTIQSSFMIWDHDAYRYIYDEFEGKHTREFIGDQNYITTKVEDPFLANNQWPEWIKSFKVELRNDEPRGDERLVYFHGFPHPKDVPWVQELWKEQKELVND